jgi:hypothetical protein
VPFRGWSTTAHVEQEFGAEALRFVAGGRRAGASFPSVFDGDTPTAGR